MRAHFKEKSSTELYQSLVNLRQLPYEDPQSFLIRALNKGQICILINAKDEIRSLIAQPLFNLFLDPRDRSEGRQRSCQIKAPSTGLYQSAHLSQLPEEDAQSFLIRVLKKGKFAYL